MTKEASRRTFLQMLGAGAAAGALPPSIARALAIPANNRTGTINDVEHVVILMQENRSFDHYFGSLRGVRGFSDPRAIKLPSGKSVWYQPSGNDELVPFRPPVENLGLTFLPDVPHGWNDTHGAWNKGRHDQWVPNKGLSSMTYHVRSDIPYHYALADAFTVCDDYHCSLMGPTDPNRYHLFSGWVGNDGKGGGPVITNAEAGYDWSTFPERLQRNGVSWKVYQDEGLGLDAAHSWGWTNDAYIGNYGDNSLLYFHQFQNAKPGNPLADRGKTGTRINNQGRDPNRLMDVFKQDVASGKLPQVSWIAAPEAYSEHPNFPADYGAWYISQVLDTLTSNPAVWSKTVLLIMYDEEGGFFDHMPPPVPPQTAAQGASTVSTVNEIYGGDLVYKSAPYGLGMRVPMLVVSPWSKGGFVNSQLFDHTSVIRFLEARFGQGKPDLTETNITPWRRAVTGDLTSAFDFATPDTGVVALPSTAAYFPPDLVRHDSYHVVAPQDDQLPQQETGLRRARALPYALHARGHVVDSDGSYRLRFGNVGDATAVFQVHSGRAGDLPRCYTVEPGKKLFGNWAVKAQGATTYDLTVRGPNGFLRGYKGSISGDTKARLDVRDVYAAKNQVLKLDLHNLAKRQAVVHALDRYTGQSQSIVLAANQTDTVQWNLEATFGWYDLVLTVDGDSGFEVQLAGHIENGLPSSSDPALGSLSLKR